MNDFKFISTEGIFAKISDQLNSYSSVGILDTGRFFAEVKWIVNKLGIGAYDFADQVIKLDNHRAELDCDFYMLDSAWLCDTKSQFNNPIMQDKFIMYNKIECERIEQDTSCATPAPVRDSIYNGVIAQATSCNNNNEQILDKVTITEYLQGQPNNFLTYTRPILLTLKNRKGIDNHCSKDCKNLFAKSPYEIQINQQGNALYLHSSLKEAIILVRYYKIPTDEQGLPLIPDHPVIQKAIEYHLMHYFFYMAWLNNDDVNIDRKIKQLEIDRDKYLVEAKNYTKMPSFQKSIELAKRVRSKFSAYEAINSAHL